MIANHHVEPIKNKIRTIFRIGLIHGHDSLVLGALGCGAFRNPPRHVARLFHEVMDEHLSSRIGTVVLYLPFLMTTMLIRSTILLVTLDHLQKNLTKRTTRNPYQ